MPYDIEVIRDLCDELGLKQAFSSLTEVIIELEPSTRLRFSNKVKTVSATGTREDDSMMDMGYEWHCHDTELQFECNGTYVELTYLDVLFGLVDGTILVCELWRPDGLVDRWPAHRDFVDEFRYLQAGDEIRIRSVAPASAVSVPA